MTRRLLVLMATLFVLGCCARILGADLVASCLFALTCLVGGALVFAP